VLKKFISCRSRIFHGNDRKKVRIEPPLPGETHPEISAERKDNMLGTILLILLVLLLIGALPTWPHSRTWGYYPSGGLGLVLLIVVLLLLLGRI
jgi:hypothetical protein